MNILWNSGFFILAILILVSIHELGHFLLARYFKVYVSKFAVGFGPTLFSIKNKINTEFAICALPLGGYVRMLSSDEKDDNGERYQLPENEQFYDQATASQRIIIGFAGPVFNFLLAILLYLWVYLFYPPQLDTSFQDVLPESTAAQQQVLTPMQITHIDDKPVAHLRQLQFYLNFYIGENTDIPITYLYQGEQVQVALPVQNWLIENSSLTPLEQLGLLKSFTNFEYIIEKIVPNSPAEKAGLQVNDQIIAAENTPITSFRDLARSVQRSNGESIQLTVWRDNRQFDVQLIPELFEQQSTPFYRIGVQAKAFTYPKQAYAEINPTFSWAMQQSILYTYQMAKFNLISLYKLVIGQLPLDKLSGPITIGEAAGSSAKFGWLSFINLLALLSISLGVINLLPVPMLDGGNILFDSIELIRGKALSLNLQILFRMLGLIVILLVMSLALFNDFFRVFTN